MTDDRDVQQMYRQERSDNKQAPDFETMWTRAQQQSQHASPPPARLVPARLTLLAAAAAVFVAAAILGTLFMTDTPDNDDALARFILELESEQALALSEWETPTDFLLSTDDDWFYEP